MSFDQPTLDAMDGVAYLMDPDGRLVAMGQPSWDAFASSNDADGARADALIGRNLFDAIQSEPVREAYRRAYAAVLAGDGQKVSFEFRCDAPALRRTMRMSISLLRRPGHDPLLLHQSQILSVVERPWVSLFEPERIMEHVRAEADIPIVRLCSFCQRVAWPEPPGWVEPEDYYRRGGPADVRTSHGVCPSCTDRLDDLVG